MSALPERIADEDERHRELPHSLWARLRADPARAPEYVALAASERHAPAAAAWVEERKRTYSSSPAELAQMAKRRHAALARFGGAATGFGGIVTLIPDLATAAWIQSRLVFFIAAAYGYDPHDPMRPAELLVIRDLYSDPLEARRALDGVGTMVAQAYVGSKMRARGGAGGAPGALPRPPAGAALRRPPDPVRGDRLQRDRQRARDARARRQGDQVLRGLRGRPRCRGANVKSGWVGGGFEVPRHHECRLKVGMRT